VVDTGCYQKKEELFLIFVWGYFKKINFARGNTKHYVEKKINY
jgi:hypothetical protein